MRRTFGVIAIVCGLVAGLATTTAGAAGKTALIKTKGSDRFLPNPKSPPNKWLVNDLAWAPGNITVHSGEKLKVVDSDKLGEPHVLAIASPKDIPHTPNLGPNNPVAKLIGPKLLVNPRNPQQGFKAFQSNAGKDGLNQEGDSLVVLPRGPHKTATWFVSAKAGTKLHYFCAVHPWMQGTIKVVK
jgi:hypothetical protein